MLEGVSCNQDSRPCATSRLRQDAHGWHPQHEAHHGLTGLHWVARAGIQASLQTAGTEWAAAQRTCAQQMLVLESLLRDHGSDASPREELLRLLGSGSLSAAMHQFLSTTLGARPLLPRRTPGFPPDSDYMGSSAGLY